MYNFFTHATEYLLCPFILSEACWNSGIVITSATLDLLLTKTVGVYFLWVMVLNLKIAVQLRNNKVMFYSFGFNDDLLNGTFLMFFIESNIHTFIIAQMNIQWKKTALNAMIWSLLERRKFFGDSFLVVYQCILYVNKGIYLNARIVWHLFW